MEAIKVEDSPQTFAYAKVLMASSLFSLGNARGNEENILSGIVLCKKAQELVNFEMFPSQYADLKFSEGFGYFYLSKIKNKEENISKALEAIDESIKIFIDNNNLIYLERVIIKGDVYLELAGQKNSSEYIYKAIELYNEALQKDLTYNKNPIIYSHAKNSLGVAYSKLSKIEESKRNVDKSIVALKEALEIRTSEEYPLFYAETICNLGLAYTMLSKIEDRTVNTQLAKMCFDEALKIYSREKLDRQCRKIVEYKKKL